MQLTDKEIFIQEFFQFQNPKPLETHFTEEELKNNDMKISLQIATRSSLRMQSDQKTNLVSFSCKNYGKNCFEIFAMRKEGLYQIQTNYHKVHHQRNCELHDEFFEYLKIYNLMKLKKNLIESCMLKKNLMNSSPSEILSEVSPENEYFFENKINYNQEMRRKLRKRFDNIINIDIKKITKGGREEVNDRQFQVLKENKNTNRYSKNEGEYYEPQFDETSFFDEKKLIAKKAKPIKKKDKLKQKTPTIKHIPLKTSPINKQNSHTQIIPHTQPKKTLQRFDDEIYINPASESQLKEIKQLNEQFNGFEDIFSWQSEDPYQPVYAQTINDKLRESVFLSLRNSLLKKSLETQSLSNFPENIGNFNDFVDDEEII